MRKPRDFDAELKELSDRTTELKRRKVQQLGELVVASGADALPIEELAGALVAMASEKNTAVREGWRKAGARMFQSARRAPGEASTNGGSNAPADRSALSLDGDQGTA